MAVRRSPSARPPRPRSQHFLRSQSLAAAIVREAGIARADLVLDLGAGTGRLTAELARAAGRVIAVELDPRLAARLAGRWPNVEVIVGDAAAVALPRQPFSVVANLPFHRTTDILRSLLDDPRLPLVRADVVVEWNVARNRALPWPSSVNGVCWGAFYEASVTRRLPRSAFAPAPAVDAGVLALRRRARPLVPEALAPQYRRFVAAGFRRGVVAVAGARATARAGSRGAAPRDLDAHAWAELFRAARSR